MKKKNKTLLKKIKRSTKKGKMKKHFLTLEQVRKSLAEMEKDRVFID